MYRFVVKKLPKSTQQIDLTVPREDIKKAYDLAFEKLRSQLSVEGFRPGKVPSAIAEKQIVKDKVYSQLVQDILPGIYSDIVKKESFKPIANPKITLKKAKEGEDWEIEILLAQKPTINLTGYKTVVKKAKAGTKSEDIWVPGKKEDVKTQEEKKQRSINAVLAALIKDIPIEIPPMILEEELEHRLAQMVDDIRKIGLTTDSYLKSKNLTMDELKKRFTQEIEDTYKLEFLLGDIADEEGIKVEKEDLEKIFSNIKDNSQRQEAEKNAYFYAQLVRKQKTLDFLTGL